MSNLVFTEKLIKGRIAEIIFEMMFRSEGYKVTHFGYEYIASEFTREEIREVKENQAVLENIRHSPDFIITDSANRINFVEVKLQSKLDFALLQNMAQATYERWSDAWYFVASREGFYFSPCEQIAKTADKLALLDTDLISQKTQDDYLELLLRYLPKSA